MELFFLFALIASIFGGGDSKNDNDKNRRREAREREERNRRYHNDLGYYEDKYGQGHP